MAELLAVALDACSIALIVCGALFFLAGTVGLLRFPDFYTRLHAMTKGDNVGLGFIAVGLALQTESVSSLGQIFVVWFLVLLASASSAHLFASNGLSRGLKPWQASNSNNPNEKHAKP